MNKVFNLIDITNMSAKDMFNAYIDNLVDLESLSKKHKNYKESKTIIKKNINLLTKHLLCQKKYCDYIDLKRYKIWIIIILKIVLAIIEYIILKKNMTRRIKWLQLINMNYKFIQ